MKFFLLKHKNHSNILEYYRRDRHGSGFIVKGNRGRHFLVCNKLILLNSREISFPIKGSLYSFDLSDKDIFIIEDNHLDLAVIALPDNSDGYPSLPLYKGTINENKPVMSAGYSMLYGSPEWKISRGYIKGHSPVPEIADPGISHFIRHSAHADIGSSGGPVVVKNGENNTWQAAGISFLSSEDRVNIHYAVPVTRIKTLITLFHQRMGAEADGDEENKVDEEEDKEKRQKQVEEELEKKIVVITRFFNQKECSFEKNPPLASYSITKRIGSASIDAKLRDINQPGYKRKESKNQLYSLYDVLRELTSWYLWRKVQNHFEADPGIFSFVEWKTVPVRHEEGATAVASVKIGSWTGI